MVVQKTNIILETVVTNIHQPIYNSPSQVKQGLPPMIDNITERRVSIHITSLASNTYHKVTINGVEQAGYCEDVQGFEQSRFIKPAIGATVAIAVYRVPETYDTAILIGTRTGVVTEDGFISTSDSKSLTAKETNKVKQIYKRR